MKKQQFSRRDFLRISAIAAGSLALAACAAPAAPSAGGGEAMSSEASKIVWWFGWGNLEPAVETIKGLESFQEHVGGAELEIKAGGVTEPLMAALAAGEPPSGGSNIDYPGMWARGVVVSVNDMIESSELIDGDDVVEAVWQGTFYGGDMIGVPSIESYLWYGLNYNAQHVEAAGLDPDNPPLTWEGRLEWHKELTEFDDGGNLIKIGLDPIDAMAGELDFAATSFGHTWWEEDTNTFALDHELMAAAIETQSEFYRIAGPDNFAGFRQVEGQGGWGGAYNAEVQSMIIEGYWHAGETTIQKPEVAEHNRATWAPVPTDREGTKIMATGPHMVQIFAEGKNPDGMFQVAEFLHRHEAMDIIFNEVGWVMGVNSWLETLDKNTYPGLAFYVDARDQVDEWIIGRRCPIHWFINTQLWELREQVYRDLMTAQEAANELQARALAEWEAQGLG